MAQGYDLPPEGTLDPLSELRHYSGNYLGGLKTDLAQGEQIDSLALTRTTLCVLLDRFADGVYKYQNNNAFNRRVAIDLGNKTKRVLQDGVTLSEVENLLERWQIIADYYARQTGRPDQTRAAGAAEKDRFLKEAKR